MFLIFKAHSTEIFMLYVLGGLVELCAITKHKKYSAD